MFEAGLAVVEGAVVETGLTLLDCIVEGVSGGADVDDGSVLVVMPEDGAVEPMFCVVVVSEVMLAARC